MGMNFQRKLPIPQEVKQEFPLTEKMLQTKQEQDAAIKAVFEGSSDKFMLIIGPCSADHRERLWNTSPACGRWQTRCPIR